MPRISRDHSFTPAARRCAIVNGPLLAGLVVVCFGMGYMLLGPLAPDTDDGDFVPFPRQESDALAKPSNLLLPDLSLTPKQVVETQMAALASYQDKRNAIYQVFAFASPANQKMTGPIARFEQMILGGQYRAMVDCDHWMAGRAIEREGLATVLVTTVDEQEKVSVYRFYLSLQPDSYPDCWMTDRVTRVFSGEIPGEHPSQAPDQEELPAVENI